MPTAMSSIASPCDSKSVMSSSDARPATWPVTTSDRLRTWFHVIMPRSMGPTRSPHSIFAWSTSSVTSRLARRTTSESTSLLHPVVVAGRVDVRAGVEPLAPQHGLGSRGDDVDDVHAVDALPAAVDGADLDAEAALHGRGESLPVLTGAGVDSRARDVRDPAHGFELRAGLVA